VHECSGGFCQNINRKEISIMGCYILSYDLGTGGNKATLFDADGNCLAEHFIAYATQYPATGWHEQQPLDWWDAVIKSTKALLNKADVNKTEIECIGISGQSLGVVPLDQEGHLLRESTPIWSDSRATTQAEYFFGKIKEHRWYQTTGNGFPPPLYSVFKIMWYRDNEPEMFERIDKVIGSKDFINYKLTGRILTDFSYASGSGVYDLIDGDYSEILMTASGLQRSILPDIVPSTQVIGELTRAAAKSLGLPQTVKVVAGGVDNSCMALGARSFEEGRSYNSQGSSSWLAVASKGPLLDFRTRPFVFAHVIPGMFMSALSIFSAGTSFRWVRDQICKNLVSNAEKQGLDVYEVMTALAERAPIGANKLVFNPSLGGGTTLDDNMNTRGAFIGLDLRHTQADIIRAAMEGIAMGLRLALDELRELTDLKKEMLVVGGGSRSKLWRRIYADIYNMDIVKTNIDQQAGALGAAALAAVGVGLWSDFKKIDDIHQVQSVTRPIKENTMVYEQLLAVYKKMTTQQSELAAMLVEL
jgi:xylulokinase